MSKKKKADSSSFKIGQKISAVDSSSETGWQPIIQKISLPLDKAIRVGTRPIHCQTRLMTTFESEIWDDLEEKGYNEDEIEEILEVVMKYVND